MGIGDRGYPQSLPSGERFFLGELNTLNATTTKWQNWEQYPDKRSEEKAQLSEQKPQKPQKLKKGRAANKFQNESFALLKSTRYCLVILIFLVYFHVGSNKKKAERLFLFFCFFVLRTTMIIPLGIKIK